MAFDTEANETEDTMLQLRHVNQWVRDQDEALAFYTEKLGLELRADVTVPEMGNFRWLTVGPVGQPDVAVFVLDGLDQGRGGAYNRGALPLKDWGGTV